LDTYRDKEQLTDKQNRYKKMAKEMEYYKDPKVSLLQLVQMDEDYYRLVIKEDDIDRQKWFAYVYFYPVEELVPDFCTLSDKVKCDILDMYISLDGSYMIIENSQLLGWFASHYESIDEENK